MVLLAQLRAVLRRAEASPTRGTLRIGRLEVNRAARSVRWDGTPVTHSPRENGLLEALASRAPAVLTKDELLTEIWGDEQAATRNNVEVYIGYLRRKLAAAGADGLVRTVRGHGYQLDEALSGG